MSRMIFVGDTFFNVGTNGALVTAELLEKCGEYDYFCANIEGPAGVNNYREPLEFNFCDNQIKEIAAAGINVGLLGNNHIFDCELKGLKETIKQCKKYKIKTVGAELDVEKVYSPLILTTRDGYKIALFSVQHRYYGSSINISDGGVADIWDHRLISSIVEIKENVDYVVVNTHCGLENQEIPLNTWRNQYKLLIDVGVDLIVGHHPHIIQCTEEYKNKLIIYSLGNFAFDLDDNNKKYVSENWYEGLVVFVDFEENNQYSITYLYGEYTNYQFHLKSINNKIKTIDEVYEKEKYYNAIGREFHDYIGNLKDALFHANIDYNTLHHYLALDEQKLVLQEYLEYLHRENDDELTGIFGYEINIYPIIIWGCGNNGINFYYFAKQMGYRIMGFTDSFVENDGELLIGNDCVKRISNKTLKEIKGNYNLVVASMYYNEISDRINELEIVRKVYYYKDFYYYYFSQLLDAWKMMDWRYFEEKEKYGINYRVFEKGNNTPLIIYLHGAGDCGNDNMRQIVGMGNLGKALIEYADIKNHSIYAPQCPLSNMWINVNYKSGFFTFEEISKKGCVMDAVLRFIKSESEKRKIYLIGYSIGAYASWYALMKCANLFKKAIIVSGGGYLAIQKTSFLKNNVLLIHGSLDKDVPVEGSRKMAETTGCKYYELSDYGHELKNNISKEMWMELLDEGFGD